jgi:hypothetical protein
MYIDEEKKDFDRNFNIYMSELQLFGTIGAKN